MVFDKLIAREGKRAEVEQEGKEELEFGDDDRTGRMEKQEEDDESLGLCKRCADIDFDVFLDPDRIAGLEKVKVDRTTKARLMLSLGHPSDWSYLTCRVCQFWYACFESVLRSRPSAAIINGGFQFISIVDDFWCPRDQARYPIYAFVPAPLQMGGISAFSACFVLEKVSQQKSFRFQVQPIESLIDICIPRSWIDYCLSSHEDCKQNESVIPISGMRLIDCRAGTVIEARATHTYLALSYVWGAYQTANQVSSHLGRLPDNLPQTVQDAIDFTLSLDRTDYLWVDSLCIDADKNVKHDQISNMDKIYQNAMLTIIAASGENSSHGISGVSKSRLKQPEVRIGSHHLISTMDRSHIVKQSAWATRGWTYQEAFLSRRRLFFSDRQMYYECGKRCCKETLKVPDSLPIVTGFYQFWRGIDFPNYDLTFPVASISSVLNEYTERIVTYDSDALNACLGVLHAFTRSDRPQFHFQGMPVPRVYGKFSSKEFAAKLLWEVRESSRTRRRRQSLPSWCWTGWDASVIIDTTQAMHFSDVDVRFETLDGQILDWERALSVIKANNSNIFSSFLHLDCETYEMAFRFDGSRFWGSMCHDHERRYIYKEDIHCGELRLTGDPEAEGLKYRLCIESWTCILMGPHWTCYDFLVVEWRGETAYRIGLLARGREWFNQSKLVKRRIRLG